VATVADRNDLDSVTELLGEFRALVSDLSDEDFGRPTRCPGWTVSEVVVHSERNLTDLVTERARPVDAEPTSDRVDVYRRDPNRPHPLVPGKTQAEVVRDDAVEHVAGRSPGELRAAFVRAVDGALSGLPSIPADRVVRRRVGGALTFGELLASRYVEFGVHMLDIEDATGRPESVPPGAAAIITGILDAVLGQGRPEALGWDATQYIVVGTGRRELTSFERRVFGPLADRFPLVE
jgi:uncharacterized protein (TIGR03083 family)